MIDEEHWREHKPGVWQLIHPANDKIVLAEVEGGAGMWRWRILGLWFVSPGNGAAESFDEARAKAEAALRPPLPQAEEGKGE